MIYILVVLAYALGYYNRSIADKLANIAARLADLKTDQDKPKPQTTFVSEMTRAELAGLAEQERIDILNQ